MHKGGAIPHWLFESITYKEPIMKTNHWGIEVDSDIPITGVYSGNDIVWKCMPYVIDPNYGWYCPFCDKLLDGYSPEICGNCNTTINWELVANISLLYGDWRQTEAGLWEPDPDGKFAAIYNADVNTLQVVYSIRLARGRLCSPCYPGQVDARVADTLENETYLYFALPEALLIKERS